MKKRVLIPFLLALLLFAALAPATFAGTELDRGVGGRDEVRVVIGENEEVRREVIVLDRPGVSITAPSSDTVIEENEEVNNDVVVLDGDLEIRRGAVVNGDVIVFNGDAIIDGRVNGSLTMFNGDLEARESAAVSGECILLNGSLRGAAVLRNCTNVENLELPPFNIPAIPALPERPARPALPEMPNAAPMPTIPAPDFPERPEPFRPSVPDGRYDRGPGFGARLASVFASSVLFTLLGLLVGAVMPNQLRQVVTTAREKPVVSGLAGILTAVAVPSLIVLLIPLSVLLTLVCIGLLGFPIMFLLALGLVLGGLLGWVTAGTWLGMRVFGRGKDDRIVRAAGLGTGLLTFAIGLLGFIPFVFGESLLVFVIASIGLGAVALTQFGMKPYPRRPRADTPDGPDADKVDVVLGTLPPEERSVGA